MTNIVSIKHATAPSTAPTKPVIHQSVFDAMPDTAMIRMNQLVTNPQHPERLSPLPFSAPTLWRKCRAGTFPRPVKLGCRITAWRVGDVRAWLVAQEAQGYTPACPIQVAQEAKASALAAV